MIYDTQTIEELCRHIVEGEPWMALEVLRRETKHTELRTTIAEAQGRLAKPWR